MRWRSGERFIVEQTDGVHTLSGAAVRRTEQNLLPPQARGGASLRCQAQSHVVAADGRA
jgi:hypothetical protein